MIPILLYCLAFFLRVPSSYTYLNTGTEIRDLFKSGTCFDSDATSWTATKLVTSGTKTSTCGDYTLMGGYSILGDSGSLYQKNEYFQRTYSSLPTHTYIYYTITFYAIDSWDDSRGDNDSFQLYFDSTAVTGMSDIPSSRFSVDTCGVVGTNDLKNLRVFGRVAHTASSLVLKIISLLGEASNNESFGFREINLLFVSPTTAPGNAICGVGPGPASFVGKCTCSEGQYDNAGTCTSCNSNCASCFGPAANQCYQCKSGNSLVSSSCTTCHSKCSVCHGSNYNECDECVAGYFLFNNTQCVYPCDPPLIQGTNGCADTCQSPCPLTDFVFWDGSCGSSCSSPLHQGKLLGAVKTCSYPCSLSQFLLSSGSCSNTCPSPLVSTNLKGRQFCLYPCSTGQYLYWNGTCADTCDFPLNQQITDGNLYCQYLCSGTQYLFWNGSCLATCPYPLSTRTENGYRFCDFPTQDVNLYLNWDGSLTSTCLLPRVSRTEGNPIQRKFCDYKCTGNDYLYWNGSCISTCSSPLIQQVQQGKNFCVYPCDISEYLYWNGSCSSTCPTEFSTRIEAGYKYCDFKCTANDFMYWDSTCSSTCLGPLTISTIGTSSPLGGKYCTYSCQTSEYLYWNGSCKSNCNAPLTQQSFKGKNLCKYTCAQTQFLYYNGSCLDNCQPPFVAIRESGKGYCNYPCTSTEYIFWNGTCIPSCDWPLVSTNGAFGEQYCSTPCINPLDYYELETGTCKKQCDEKSRLEKGFYLRCMIPVVPDDVGLVDELLTAEGGNGFSFLVLPKPTQYVRYLKIQQSPRLQRLTLTTARTFFLLRFGLPLPNGLLSILSKQPLPDNFERGSLHSSFLINYWSDLTSLFIIFGATIVLTILAAILKRTSLIRVYLVFEKLKIIFKWNFWVVYLALHIDDVILFSSLEIRTLSFKSSITTVSLLIAVIMMIISLALLASTILLLRKSKVLKDEDTDSKTEFLKKWEGWQVAFSGFKQDRLIKRFFYIFYIFRVFLPMLFAVIFSEVPLVQSVFQFLLSVITLAYLLLLAPLKKTINQVQLLTLEGLFFVINLSAFILAVFDQGEASNSRARVLLGDIILISSFLANLIPIVFLPVKLVFEVISVYRFQKESPVKDPSLWVKLLVVPLQQFAFGFEEIFEENAVSPILLELAKPPEDLPNLEQVKIKEIKGSEEYKKGVFDNINSTFGSVEDNLYASNAQTNASLPPVNRIDRLRNLTKKNVPINRQPIFEEAKEEDTARLVRPNDVTASTIFRFDQPRRERQEEDRASTPALELPSMTSINISHDAGLNNLLKFGFTMGNNEPESPSRAKHEGKEEKKIKQEERGEEKRLKKLMGLKRDAGANKLKPATNIFNEEQFEFDENNEN